MYLSLMILDDNGFSIWKLYAHESSTPLNLFDIPIRVA